MAEDGYQIVEAAPVRPPNSHLRDFIPASDVIPQLAACLALVRPVSMSEEAAAEWLAVAAAELAGYRRWLVLAALEDARRHCTFHGQIIPHAIKHMEDSTPWRMGKPLERLSKSAPEQLPPPEIRGLIESAAKALKA